MRLPSDLLPRAARAAPADLTSSGASLFPALPQPTSATQAAQDTTATFDAYRICEAFIFPFTFAAARSLIVLPRTSQKRLSLLIVNVSVLGGIFYNFDNDASNVNGIPIALNGNRLFDSAVPQGSLFIFGTGAGVVSIEYLLPSSY